MFRHILVLVVTFSLLVLASLACGIAPLGTEAPNGEEEPVEPIGPMPTATAATDVPAPTANPPEPTLMPTPEIEQRTVEVEWPASMRVGDSDVIRLSLIPAEEGYVAVPELPEHEIEHAEVPVFVARPGYTGYAVASLSAAGLETERAGPEEQLLVPGQPNTWRWTISSAEAGTYRVVVNLTVRWEPDADTDLPGPFEDAVWSRILSVEARATLGLSGRQADLVGVGGSVVGLVSGVPFAEKILEGLWRRFRRQRGEGVEAKCKGKEAPGSEKAD